MSQPLPAPSRSSVRLVLPAVCFALIALCAASGLGVNGKSALRASDGSGKALPNLPKSDVPQKPQSAERLVPAPFSSQLESRGTKGSLGADVMFAHSSRLTLFADPGRADQAENDTERAEPISYSALAFEPVPGKGTGSITADPNPIQVCDGSGLGITTLSWTSSGTSVVEVHVGSPTGTLLASTGSAGSQKTGKWVSNGTVFYLQDVSGGLPLTAANTLATVTVGVTTCAPSNPVYGGWLDGADCAWISGWAWDSNQPNTPITVDIFDGITLITTLTANQFRQDLQNAGIGNGYHGFSIQTPLSLKNGVLHSIRVKFSGTSTDLSGNPKSLTCASGSSQSPFNGTHNVPGITQAEDFDNGGEGVSYHDNDAGNAWGYYRTNVDVDITPDANAGGGASIGNARTGEWLEYTVNVTATGSYDLVARVASDGPGGVFHYVIDPDSAGPIVTPQLTVPNTFGWSTYQNAPSARVSLSQGTHIIRVSLDQNGTQLYPAIANFDSFNGILAPTRTGSITANPNPIQVCDGSGLGISTLSWSSTGTSMVEVHVGSPGGALFASTGPSGSWTTGKWVSNGTVFYLQDVSGGLPLTAANTLATVTIGVTTTGCPPLRKPPFDYDGDRKSDIAVRRPSEGNWYIIDSSTGASRAQQWGSPSDMIVPRDYDGDGKTDLAVWRPAEANWYILNSSTGAGRVQQWGGSSDIPVARDYDGDNKADIAVYRPSDGNWYIITSSNGTYTVQQFGSPGDQPVAADYDGDARADIAVYRPSTGYWYIINSSNGTYTVQQFGSPGDQPVAADYDGDGRSDIAVWRPSEGNWYIINSSTGATRVQLWGFPADIPVPADYDGDGKTDVAIWRPNDGNWWIINSSTGAGRVQQWGLGTAPYNDVPTSRINVAASLAPNASTFISQSVPASMVAGQSYNVSVTIKNTGTNTWTSANLYRLGSQNPQDNLTWGTGRVALPASVAPGSQVTFNFTVTAPATPNTYNFQWRMVQDGVMWFGDFTTNMLVTVSSPNPGSRAPHNATQTPWSVPSNNIIEVEDFDDWNPPKGEGHTYHDDTMGNEWGLYRPGEDVEIGNSSDVGGGYIVGNSHGGEWLEYTINVTSNPFDVQVRVASGGPGGRFHVDFDGVNRTGPIQVPDTGGWGTWMTLTASNISLPLGQHIMRLALDQNGTQPYPAVADFNYIRLVTPSVNQPPTVSITAPTSGMTFTAPANITITANAGDPDGTISKVEFFAGATLLNTDFQVPYSFNWNNVPVATYSLTARATDSAGAQTTSSPAVIITVGNPPNQPPTVNITAPGSGAIFTAPATIPISAAASDPDGTVSKVEFFGDGSLIGTVNAAPYNFTWSNVGTGAHSIRATATDNLGAATNSATIGITVNSSNPPLQPPTDSLTANQIGRLTSVGNGSMRIFNSYDALGRTTQTVHKLDGTNYVSLTRYGYPQNPSTTPGPGTAVSFQSLPDFERLDYTYDASGAQQSIKTTPRSAPQQTIISSVFHNARGQSIAATYGNGAISIQKYNEGTNLRLNQIQTAVGGNLMVTGGIAQISGGTTLQNYGYDFDNNGNVIGVTDNLTSTLSAAYGYDSLDQLKSMTPANQALLAYDYDPLGNLKNKEGVAQTYYTGGVGRGPHALATSNNGAIAYNYDANGNLTSTSNGTFITWNAENMPIQVVQGGVTKYQKFFLGESLWKKVEPGLNLTTYYLPSMRVENGQFRKFFGGFAERSPDGSLKFYHGDHLGSASLVTDLAGTVIRRQTYMPYGEDRFVSGTFTDARYQFNFKEKESTGFYDFGSRLYFPAIGRWLSADSSANDGLNRYSYVRNNPLRYTDPTGHDSESHIYDQAYIEATGVIMGLGLNESFTLHARGMLNGNLDRGSVRKMQLALGGKVAGIPNSTWLHGAGMAGLFGRSAPFAVDHRAVAAWIQTIDKWNKYGGQHGLRLSSFSNGVNTLASGLEMRTPKNLKEILIMNPNTTMETMRSIVSHSGGAAVRIVLGGADEFGGLFVVQMSLVAEFAGPNFRNVSVEVLPNRDHSNKDMARGLRKREGVLLLDRGMVTKDALQWTTPHSPQER